MMMDRAWRARVLPFSLYIAGLVIADLLGRVGVTEPALRWLYPVKIMVVAGLLWHYRDVYKELRGAWPSLRQCLLAVAAGLLVFVLWINLGAEWMSIGQSAGYAPLVDGQINWELVVFRACGAALVVPLMEELFWRSFLMRWLDRPAFLTVTPAAVTLKALIVSSVLFGVEHNLWFAGVIAGCIYGELYRRSGLLWTAVLAHGVTNGVLAGWIVATGNWTYW